MAYTHSLAVTRVFRDVVFQDDVGFEHNSLKPLTHISFRCEVPTPSVLRVNQLLLSNPTSSNTTSLNSRVTIRLAQSLPLSSGFRIKCTDATTKTPFARLSCDVHTHTPARTSSTNFQLYNLVIQTCSIPPKTVLSQLVYGISIQLVLTWLYKTTNIYIYIYTYIHIIHHYYYYYYYYYYNHYYKYILT